MLVTVDTGGTKTLVASFSDAGEIVHSVKFATPTKSSHYVTQLTSTIASIVQPSEIDAIVIALPGVVSASGVLLDAENLGWHNLDMKQELAHFYSGPVLVENDGNLAGLGEARQLPVTPPVMLGIAIGTGIGTGIISGGKIDPRLRQSEGGLIVLEHDGVLKLWEDFASGRAIKLANGKFAHDITSKRAWKEIGTNISRGLLVHIPTLRPDVIIIGGSIGTYFEKYQVTLQTILRSALPSHIAVPQIVKAAYPEQAVIYGCYYYALDSLADSAS
jgi:glucokinase